MEQQGAHADVDHGFGHVEAPLEVAEVAVPADHPGEGALNSLIANDKSSLTRTGRLRLGWPKARGRPRGANAPQLGGECKSEWGSGTDRRRKSLIQFAKVRRSSDFGQVATLGLCSGAMAGPRSA